MDRTILAGVLALCGALVPPAPATAQVTDDVVKIGVMIDSASPYADAGGLGLAAAVRMAVADFGGTVAGKKIEVLVSDFQNKADVGATVARKWLDSDGVDAIIDAPTSSLALAIQHMAREKGKVFFVSGAGASDLTGKACSPTGVHWTYDTYALAQATGRALTRQGADSWFFLTADYAFGHALQRDTAAVVAASGGKVVGTVRHPLNTSDFSSFLLQAQASKAKIVALANSGGDTTNAIKQAREFGIIAGGQKLAGLLIFVSDVNALGLEAAQGLLLTEAFYWDQNDETRAFAKRYVDEIKKVPTMVQAGAYGAALHYLKAVQATGSDDGPKVMAKMRETPINDFMTRNGKLREDGRVMRDMYLFQVKTPAESKGRFDFYKQLAVIPAEEAFRPLAESECPLVKRN
jgi:branched-chain amino acid transport system substrate-binding protein